MQKSISKAAVTWRLILSVLIVGSFISCEDTNTVGGGVVEPSAIRVDTIFISDFNQRSSDMYSGQLSNMPIGYYNDQLFGTFNATGYIRPNLLSSSLSPVSDTTKLKLLLENKTFLSLGDTTSSVNYSIYKVTERWRGRTLLSSDNINYDELELAGSFTYQNEESITVNLSDSISAEYIRFVNNENDNRDSLYNAEFFGLAVVPDQNSSQIMFPDISSSRFFFVDGSSNDTTRLTVADYGFTLERQNEPSFADRYYLNSNLESYYSLNFSEIANTIGSKNILNAEVYLYEDTTQVNNSLPVNHVRPALNLIDMKSIDDPEFKYELQFSGTDYFGFRDSTDNAFVLNITTHINEYLFGELESEDLYLIINPNGGLLKSSIFYDTNSSDALKPKLILTIAEQ